MRIQIAIALLLLLTSCVHQQEDCTSCSAIVKYMKVGQ